MSERHEALSDEAVRQGRLASCAQDGRDDRRYDRTDPGHDRGVLALGMGLGYALSVKNLSVVNVECYTGIDQRPGETMCTPTLRKTVRRGLIDDDARHGRTLDSSESSLRTRRALATA